MRLESLVAVTSPHATGGMLTISYSVPTRTIWHSPTHSHTHITFSQTHTSTPSTCILTNVPLRSRLPLPCVATPGDAQSCYLSMFLTLLLHFPLFHHPLETGDLVWWHSGDQPHRSTRAHTDEASLSRPQCAHALIKCSLIRIHWYCRSASEGREVLEGKPSIDRTKGMSN